MLTEVWIGLSGHLRRLAVAGAMAAFAATAFAQSQMTAPKESDVPLDYAMDSKDKLAQQLNNPLANLITVPIQNNFDYGGGRDDKGFRYTLVAQPVLPFTLNKEWNLITRTIIPFAHVDNVFPSSESGVGDIVQSLWFSPSRPTEGGLIWGVGPAVLYPTRDQRSPWRQAVGPGADRSRGVAARTVDLPAARHPQLGPQSA